MSSLLRRLPELAADDLGGLLAVACASVSYPMQAAVFLSDCQERVLVELDESSRRVEPPLSVAGSLAGRAFVSQEPVPSSDGALLWVPLTNRWRRLGVLRLEYATDRAAQAMHDGLALAGLVATVLDSASRCTDVFHQAKREQDMALTAEMQWDLLPPLAVAGVGVTMAGRLEPAYDVGGDSFDYAVNGNVAHVAIFDPVGHDLRSASLAATAVGAYRHSRRSGHDVVETSARIDAAIRSLFPWGVFVTGQLFQLDVTSGRLTWTNAGHPLPLLLRDGRAAPVSLAPDRPWGLGPAPATSGQISLQPGDRLMVITDGVLEARSSDGDAFGLDRLVDVLTREADHPGSPAEVLRRVLDATMDHRGERLQDDATGVLLEWQGHHETSPLGG